MWRSVDNSQAPRGRSVRCNRHPRVPSVRDVPRESQARPGLEPIHCRQGSRFQTSSQVQCPRTPDHAENHWTFCWSDACTMRVERCLLCHDSSSFRCPQVCSCCSPRARAREAAVPFRQQTAAVPTRAPLRTVGLTEPRQPRLQAAPALRLPAASAHPCRDAAGAERPISAWPVTRTRRPAVHVLLVGPGFLPSVRGMSSLHQSRPFRAQRALPAATARRTTRAVGAAPPTSARMAAPQAQ